MVLRRKWSVPCPSESCEKSRTDRHRRGQKRRRCTTHCAFRLGLKRTCTMPQSAQTNPGSSGEALQANPPASVKSNTFPELLLTQTTLAGPIRTASPWREPGAMGLPHCGHRGGPDARGVVEAPDIRVHLDHPTNSKSLSTAARPLGARVTVNRARCSRIRQLFRGRTVPVRCPRAQESRKTGLPGLEELTIRVPERYTEHGGEIPDRGTRHLERLRVRGEVS